MPSSRRLRFTPEADTDLENRLQHSAHTWGEQQMEVYATELLYVINHLCRFPHLGLAETRLRPVSAAIWQDSTSSSTV